MFAVAMRCRPAKATFRLAQSVATKTEVLGENRTIPVADGAFADEFAPYAVHLYRVK